MATMGGDRRVERPGPGRGDAPVAADPMPKREAVAITEGPQAHRRGRGWVKTVRRWLLGAAAIAIAAFVYLQWESSQPAPLPSGFVATNGRIEGTEVDVATKLQGRVVEILVDEGDFVTAGQVVARMDTEVLKAQLREAEAKLREAKSGLEAAQSNVRQREGETADAEAMVAQRAAELDDKAVNFKRVERLTEGAFSTTEEYTTARAQFLSAKAAVATAQAVVAASAAVITTAKMQVVEAEASIEAAKATIERIQADIDDSMLKGAARRPRAVSRRPARRGAGRGRQGAEHGRPD